MVLLKLHGSKCRKCHFMYHGKNTENETFVFKDIITNNSKEEKILDVTVDNRLTFSSHIRELCIKNSQKISSLTRISNQLNDSKKNFFNAVVKSHFNYCAFVWMFCLTTSSSMINKEHEIVILVDNLYVFESLLENNKDICSNHKNTQYMIIEIFKIKSE